MRDTTLSPIERPVTRLARRMRPDLQAQRPQGVEGLVWDALALELRPLRVSEIAAVTDLSRLQVAKAVGRLKSRGLVDGYRVPGRPSGYRMAYWLVVAP